MIEDKYTVECPFCHRPFEREINKPLAYFEEELKCPDCWANFVAIVSLSLEYRAEGITMGDHHRERERRRERSRESR